MRRAAIPLFFLLVAVVLTWPMVVSPGSSVAVRGDYYLSIWNAWWFKTVLFGPGRDLFYTDYLHAPEGVSLIRNATSPLNAFIGAVLGKFLDLHTAVAWLHLLHFALSGWFCFLFARAVTGSTRGAVLAGLFFAYGPFGFYYLPQMNVSTMEFLPLAGWFMVRCYRSGGAGNLLGVVGSALLLAVSSLYYLVYIGLLGAALLLGGRLWAPEESFRVGGRRLALAALVAMVAVLAVTWPLVSETVAAGSESTTFDSARHVAMRSNDLLGFRWVGPPERVVLAWPAFLGYAGLIIMLAGTRWRREQLFWGAAALAFLVLSCGPVLTVASRSTGFPLPYEWFTKIPVLWMLRKPDRIAVMLLLCSSVHLAWSWRFLAVRMAAPTTRTVVLCICGAIIVAERVAAPLAVFEQPSHPYLHELARDESVRSLVDLPFGNGRPVDARSNQFQTMHGKRIPQGYVVEFALTPKHLESGGEWLNAQGLFWRGEGERLIALARRQGIDAILVRKLRWRQRDARLEEGRIIWAPFVVARDPLMLIRQTGAWTEQRTSPRVLREQRAVLVDLLGAPAFENETMMVFKLE